MGEEGKGGRTSHNMVPILFLIFFSFFSGMCITINLIFRLRTNLRARSHIGTEIVKKEKVENGLLTLY